MEPTWEVRWPEESPAPPNGATTARDEMEQLDRQLQQMVLSQLADEDDDEYGQDYDAEVRDTFHDYVGRDDVE